jgi:hypothetical protein
MTKLVQRDPLHVVEEDNISPPPHYTEEGPPQVISSDTARQAPRGTRVLWVLIASMIAIFVAWAIVDWYAH